MTTSPHAAAIQNLKSLRERQPAEQAKLVAAAAEAKKAYESWLKPQLDYHATAFAVSDFVRISTRDDDEAVAKVTSTADPAIAAAIVGLHQELDRNRLAFSVWAENSERGSNKKQCEARLAAIMAAITALQVLQSTVCTNPRAEIRKIVSQIPTLAELESADVA